jgi:hypothetical protein
MTSREAIQRFIDAQTPNIITYPTHSKSTPTQHAQRAERAGRDLEQMGV